MDFFSILSRYLLPQPYKQHLTIEDELMRLKKCSSRERIIGYDKLFRIVL